MSSSSGSLTQYFLKTLQSTVNHILNYPLTDLKFVFPVVAVIIASGVVRHFSVKQRVDSSPAYEKKREKFSLPADRFNAEVGVILNEKYGSYVGAMENDLYVIERIRKRFMKLLRRYRRYDTMARSTFERRSKKGKSMRKQVLNDLIDTYAEIKKMDLSAITLELEEN